MGKVKKGKIQMRKCGGCHENGWEMDAIHHMNTYEL